MGSISGHFVMIPADQYERFLSIEHKLDCLLKEVSSSKSAVSNTEDNSWLTAPQFCNKYSIGRATLARKVKEGKVEILDPGEYIKKYRRVV